MKIKLTASIVLNGEIRKSGTACDVPDRLGRELIARGKAAEVAADAKANISSDTASNATKPSTAAQNNGGKK